MTSQVLAGLAASPSDQEDSPSPAKNSSLSQTPNQNKSPPPPPPSSSIQQLQNGGIQYYQSNSQNANFSLNDTQDCVNGLIFANNENNNIQINQQQQQHQQIFILNSNGGIYTNDSVSDPLQPIVQNMNTIHHQQIQQPLAPPQQQQQQQMPEVINLVIEGLSNDDLEIIEICNRLMDQTYQRGVCSSGLSTNVQFKSDVDEFTQNGVRKCIKFCMNLPGNNDLCTDDRAKLLKYGVYEIAVNNSILSVFFN